MMRKGTSGRRRLIALAAIVIALAVGAPELAGAAGAATTRSTSRTELQTRPAARKTLTDAQKTQIAQYIRAHPQVLKNRKPTKRRVRATKRTVKRRLSRKGRKAARKSRAAKRKRAAKKRKAKRKANARKRKARRGAVAAKRGKAKKAKKKKKAGSSSSSTLIHWIALLFLIASPFIAVALLLFGTDYRRRPRAPSSKKRRGVLVVTPVGRKY